MKQRFRIPAEEASRAEQFVTQFFETRTLSPDALLQGRGRFLLAVHERWWSRGGWNGNTNQRLWKLFDREVSGHFGSFQNVLKAIYPLTFDNATVFVLTLLLHWDGEKGTFQNYPETAVREVYLLLTEAIYGSIKELRLSPESDAICWLDTATFGFNWESVVSAIAEETEILLPTQDELGSCKKTVRIFPTSVENGCGILRNPTARKVVVVRGLEVVRLGKTRKIEILLETK